MKKQEAKEEDGKKKQRPSQPSPCCASVVCVQLHCHILAQALPQHAVLLTCKGMTPSRCLQAAHASHKPTVQEVSCLLHENL